MSCRLPALWDCCPSSEKTEARRGRTPGSSRPGFALRIGLQARSFTEDWCVVKASGRPLPDRQIRSASPVLRRDSWRYPRAKRDHADPCHRSDARQRRCLRLPKSAGCRSGKVRTGCGRVSVSPRLRFCCHRDPAAQDDEFVACARVFPCIKPDRPVSPAESVTKKGPGRRLQNRAPVLPAFIPREGVG